MKIIIFFIILILIFINGLTDAPNAIAVLVGSNAMSFNKARKMSAICEVLGIIIMSILSISVAERITSMIDFTYGDIGLIGLGVGILSTIVFSFISYTFGIPTSESHGLIAGITGSAIAISGFQAVKINEWLSVVYGLVWSFFGAVFFTKIIYLLFYKRIRKMKKDIVIKMQILSSCGISFMHGAQDGLKFIGILVIYNALMSGYGIPQYLEIKDNIVVSVICAITMALGVLNGGENIVKKVGSEIININNSIGLCSDFATIITLFVASIFGMPVSTTHARTLSIIASGMVSESNIDRTTIGGIVKAWIFTFPVCGIIAYMGMKITILMGGAN